MSNVLQQTFTEGKPSLIRFLHVQGETASDFESCLGMPPKTPSESARVWQRRSSPAVGSSSPQGSDSRLGS